MKAAVLTIALFAGVFLSSCQKETITPQASNTKTTVSTPVTTATATTTAQLTQSVAPAVDTVKGFLRVQLAKDAANTDNILINFNPGASPADVVNEDAPYLKGMGVVNLSSLSSDNKECAINALPLTAHGRAVALKVNAAANGTYKLNLMTVQSIPDGVTIYLKDNYLRDSLDFRRNTSYAFNIVKADSTTYGAGRFSIVLHKN